MSLTVLVRWFQCCFISSTRASSSIDLSSCITLSKTFFFMTKLFTTKASPLRTLRVLDRAFQKRRNLLTSEELSCIFPNLPQVYSLHANLCESMKRLRDSPLGQGIWDIVVSRLENAVGEEFQEQVSHLCGQQSQALELIKNKQRKDLRFSHLMQECEASTHCRWLQLKDLLLLEMQRLTKYPLLLNNIIK
ncbi:hypothetical protein P4O66_001288 [Electrophorus voltai]|uniref:DH domain-containing protein n=1 Tax=Electrophorus voltai TaxID=2609070 RepID=A0AAD9DVQ3_9TELE|nr:hypothetical protein P4O66_001288 [Electrophorus voltai]